MESATERRLIRTCQMEEDWLVVKLLKNKNKESSRSQKLMKKQYK